MMAEFQQPSNFEDFFNFEMLAGPSSGPGSSSRSSTNSPAPSFGALPPTPPNPFDLAYDPTSTYFTLFDDELSKLDPQAIAPMSSVSTDFMGTFPPAEESSSDSSGDSPSTIDPQLVETPATSAQSEFGGEDDDVHEEEELPIPEDDDDDDLADIIPIKVGGKGKQRKGTVQSGGVVKKIGGGKKNEELKPAGMLSTTTMDPDDWRPTPEEYKKMSSKEKRQLRNKISARNFRVRRKEYITTLEGDIAERDRLLDAIRTELRNTSDENRALRQEIDALKKALIAGRAETPILPPPAPLPPISAAAALVSSGLKSPPPTPSPQSPMVTPNVHKDLPMSPRLAGRNFWGGNHGFGGITPVHTTLVPDLASVLSGKPSIASKRNVALQENINPMLNGQMQPEKTMELSLPMTPFDSFTETNPFTMKTLDAYRMHLWTRMAQMQAHQHQQKDTQAQASPSRSPSSSPQLSGLAGNLRPHYFAKGGVLTSVLSGKSATSAYPSPPSTPPTLHAALPSQASSSKHQQPHMPNAQQVMLASMASQTLFGKLGSAFWEAFSGGSIVPGSSPSKLDTDKVRRVLEGKAVLRVVDVDAPSTATPSVGLSSSERLTPPRSPRLSTPVGEKKCINLEKMFGTLHI
ncbi:hypothetical protein PHLGIDRAFT_33148 [Phlebiopsis gigantea 11061_1 CR5-6]|uniref:BZIP domain-containing protein n=1 Tax=Phlebiopsis gigantea (strain 11061_1 CR5-6) TaxID=745531 RepID=A0A0C3S6I6_PHLG1|nr:hypothetical protein PHLGIDRAFT_33148 [Phlebiopsis gigantea 11061_1 CR5-6]